MRAKRRGEHVVQSHTNGARGGGKGSFVELPPTCRSAWCEGLPRVMGAAEGPGYVSRVAIVCGPPLPSAYGPNLARITSDSWGLLSCCLFDETRV